MADSAKIGVVGLGYVGLPLVILAGVRGCYVCGIDQDEGRIANLIEGKSYISDIPDKDVQLLLDNGLLRASTDYSELSSCDVIVVCVPTPLTDDKKPDYTYLLSAARNIAAVLHPGQLVIIESTVAPGTTATEILPLLETNGLTAGKDFHLSYSPERIDPGNKQYRLNNIPKLVAGLTPACQALALLFYKVLGLATVPVRTIETAEMAKLLENTYRDVNIALVNEMAIVCHRNALNIWEVIYAASTKPFGFQPFYPGPGVGGHCVPVDSVYYAFWARESGIPAELAEHARRVNSYMPHYITEMVRDALAAEGKALFESKILVLGVSYKKDVGDMRESSAIKLIEILEAEGAEVNYHDPFIENIQIKQTDKYRVTLNERIISSYDCVILAVAHSYYNPAWLNSLSTVIVDLTNTLTEIPDKKLNRL